MYIASNQIFLRLKAEDILDIAIKSKDVDTYIYKITNESQLLLELLESHL